MAEPAISTGRMVRAVEHVRRRLLKACAALEGAGVPFAVGGGHAVAAWVASVDEAATRTTREVDVMVRRPDLARVREALEGAGFTYRQVAGIDLFLERPDGSARDAVHLVFEGETVRPGEPVSNPSMELSSLPAVFPVLDLTPLVAIKLTAYRDKDRVHVRDLIDVGLVDATWRDRLPPVLWQRLEALLLDPLG